MSDPTDDPRMLSEQIASTGLRLGAADRHAEAAAAFRQALRLSPENPRLANNFAVACERSGALAEAERAYRQCIRMKPDYAEAHNNLGNTLRKMDRVDEAVACHRHAIELRAEFPEAFMSLGRAYTDLGRQAEAIDAYRRAVQLRPDAPAYGSALLYTLHYDPTLTPEQVRDEHLAWARRPEEPLRPAAGYRHSNDPNPDRRLRLGYVSPDFRRHANCRFFEPLLTHHDRDRFEIYCYASVKQPDDTTARLRACAAGWRDILSLSDEQGARVIREDQIDVLVDLAGHGAGGRPLLFARKPAPVQVAMVGYQDTTGLAAMDYRVTDEWMDPSGMTDHLYTERLLRLPRSSWCYRAAPDSPPVAAPPALRNGFITFGCLNRLIKVTPQMLRVWSQIMAAVPGSRLLLALPGGDRDNPSARRHAVQHGIPGDRLQLLERASPDKYLERYSLIDIALDSFPYTGATTTCDALWMGVPVVSLAGRTNVSRTGAGILPQVGLGDLVRPSPDEYVQCAVALARDSTRLQKIRSSLRDTMSRGPLRDEAGYTRAVESAFGSSWQHWCGTREVRCGPF